MDKRLLRYYEPYFPYVSNNKMEDVHNKPGPHFKLFNLHKEVV